MPVDAPCGVGGVVPAATRYGVSTREPTVQSRTRLFISMHTAGCTVLQATTNATTTTTDTTSGWLHSGRRTGMVGSVIACLLVYTAVACGSVIIIVMCVSCTFRPGLESKKWRKCKISEKKVESAMPEITQDMMQFWRMAGCDLVVWVATLLSLLLDLSVERERGVGECCCSLMADSAPAWRASHSWECPSQ